MIVQLGESVMGKDGKLGRIAGFSIDQKSQSADQMVIKHGLPFHSGHLAVLGHVTEVQEGQVHVDLSKRELEQLEQYNRNAYRAGDPGVGEFPPAHLPSNTGFEYGRNVGLPPRANIAGTETPLNDTHRMTPSYPSESDAAPEEQRLTVITEGMDVWDSAGTKIGQIRSFAVETTTGEPRQLTWRSSGGKESNLPTDWVERYTSRGIILKVSREQIKEREGASR